MLVRPDGLEGPGWARTREGAPLIIKNTLRTIVGGNSYAVNTTIGAASGLFADHVEGVRFKARLNSSPTALYGTGRAPRSQEAGKQPAMQAGDDPGRNAASSSWGRWIVPRRSTPSKVHAWPERDVSAGPDRRRLSHSVFP
jgi:hypothetical protein